MNRHLVAQKSNTFSVSVFAFSAGVYFAVLQFAYFFLLEAYLTSRSISFFIALFFWLIGFLIGLNLQGHQIQRWIFPLSILGYYVFYFVNVMFPFKTFTLAFLAICIVISGLYPGYFFVMYNSKFDKIKNFFYIENNGFIIGIIFSYFGSIFAGNLFIKFFPFVAFGFAFLAQLAPNTKSVDERL
ncbi:MAG: hypothetical protein HQ510_06425 [Candidatus Marinimicrobia bacterium]|nr:hypothetical protein [Candidatus Neomarinimicrobiota bacterium]